jgi:hypothetical protein
MCLSEFLLVLFPEDLGEDERNECETTSPLSYLKLVVRQRNLCVCSVREFSGHEGGGWNEKVRRDDRSLKDQACS